MVLRARPDSKTNCDIRSTPGERPKWCLPVLKAPRLGVGGCLKLCLSPRKLERWEVEGSGCVYVGAGTPRYCGGWGREGAEAWPDQMCDWVGGWVSACLLSLVFSSQAKRRRETKFRAWSPLRPLPRTDRWTCCSARNFKLVRAWTVEERQLYEFNVKTPH